jgi:undecaprenyl diphosphate synthase
MADVTVDLSSLPRHLAFIMDGNGRWAKKRGLARTAGHLRGVRAAKNVVRAAMKYRIPTLTMYAFSTENFNRPTDEVSFLMKLFLRSVERYGKFFVDNEIRFVPIGNADVLPNGLRVALENLRESTAGFSRITVIVAIGYGAREEITSAARKIAAKRIPEAEITWATVADSLYTREFTDPDMVIRTSGEKRLSNFLLLQAAYSELYFIDAHWPDVDEDTFVDILREYAKRNRRMGEIL